MDFEKHFESEQNRYGIISGFILIIGCLGGITVGLGAIKDTWALILVVVPTMTTLSLLLAVAPMQWIVKSAAVTATIDIVIILYYTLL
jgi:hypothetical protein